MPDQPPQETQIRFMGEFEAGYPDANPGSLAACILNEGGQRTLHFHYGDPVTPAILHQVDVPISSGAVPQLTDATSIAAAIADHEATATHGAGGGSATGGAGGVLSGSYPNPGFAVDMAEQSELVAHTSAASPHTGHVNRSATASPATPAALTGTLGTVGTALTALATTYSSTVATNANNNYRRLMDTVNALRTEVEAIRAHLVSQGIYGS